MVVLQCFFNVVYNFMICELLILYRLCLHRPLGRCVIIGIMFGSGAHGEQIVNSPMDSDSRELD
jgi:hypothetical protein